MAAVTTVLRKTVDVEFMVPTCSILTAITSRLCFGRDYEEAEPKNGGPVIQAGAALSLGWDIVAPKARPSLPAGLREQEETAAATEKKSGTWKEKY